MKYKLLYTSLLICTAYNVFALDFNSTAKTLAAESLSVKSTLLSNSAAVEELKGSNSLPPIETEFGYLWGENQTINKWNIRVTQSMDWPGAYSARNKGIEAAQKAISAANRIALMTQALEIKQAMIDIVLAKQYVELSSNLNDTISVMIEAIRRGVDQGEITRLDLNKLEIERIAVSKQLAADKRALTAAVSALESLCGNRDVEAIVKELNQFPEEILLPEAKYKELLTEENPAIFEAKQNALSAKALAKAEKRMLLPGFSIGYTYENEVEDKWHGIVAGVSIPLFSSRGNAKAAKLKAEAAESEAIMCAVREVANLKSERSQALNLFEEKEQYKSVFEREDNLKLLKKALEAGQMTLIEYLGELNFFISAKREYIDVLYQYSQVMARLNRLYMMQ